MTTAADSLATVLAEVRRIHVQSRRLVRSGLSGAYGSVFRGAGMEFDEVREYVEGDDPRAIDWNVTARTGKPYLKKYVDERELTVFFVLDQSRSMAAGSGRWSTGQMAIRLCACLALSAVGHHDKVGLVAGSGARPRWLPARRGLHHALRVLRAGLQGDDRGRGTDLGALVEFLLGRVRRRALVFVLSDFLAADWEAPLQRCARRHDTVAVHLRPPELTAPPAELLRVRDPESGQVQVIDFASPRVRAAWDARVAAFTARVAERCAWAGAERIDVPIPLQPDADAVTAPLVRFFLQRQARRR